MNFKEFINLDEEVVWKGKKYWMNARKGGFKTKEEAIEDWEEYNKKIKNTKIDIKLLKPEK